MMFLIIRNAFLCGLWNIMAKAWIHSTKNTWGLSLVLSFLCQDQRVKKNIQLQKVLVLCKDNKKLLKKTPLKTDSSSKSSTRYLQYFYPFSFSSSYQIKPSKGDAAQYKKSTTTTTTLIIKLILFSCLCARRFLFYSLCTSSYSKWKYNYRQKRIR